MNETKDRLFWEKNAFSITTLETQEQISLIFSIIFALKTNWLWGLFFFVFSNLVIFLALKYINWVKHD